MKAYFKYLNFLIYFIVIIFQLLPPSIDAKTKETYRPPDGKVRRQARKAGGSRGCNLPLDDTVTLLVPQDHTATTVSDRPIFFWHLSQQLSSTLRFTLLEPGKKPIFTQELSPEPGIVALKLPQNSPPLEVGKTYRWTVTIVCNPQKPSKNLFAQAWIERVPLPTSQTFTENVNNISLCSIEYAQAGIWYDAIACNYTKYLENEADFNSPQFWSLLEEIDLQNLAREKPKLSFY